MMVDSLHPLVVQFPLTAQSIAFYSTLNYTTPVFTGLFLGMIHCKIWCKACNDIQASE